VVEAKVAQAVTTGGISVMQEVNRSEAPGMASILTSVRSRNHARALQHKQEKSFQWMKDENFATENAAVYLKDYVCSIENKPDHKVIV